ncbi:heme biosynthesis protein HemY [Stenotrophomonas tumulicola]|uniref:Heme biosynthesis protein HemY n=1 Tax=Stenotrophomonas tumulicola TaxID=1685415 RepID=A0A7W3IJV9_9GAMM|nr:heme biosynthesis HemY N-terminal domain-containing protein [Stenotrophomonas tumulicola]MBA8683044.1 heme biosynthesis protein HemY [Stenotrophomonas tumulicola]
MKPLQSVIVLLLAVALGVIGAQWLGANDLRQYGEVILRHGGTDYRSTLPQVVLLTLVVLLVLWLLWSLVASPFRAWGRYRRKQGRVRLVDGLQAYEQGQWQRAEKLFDGAAQDQEVTAVALANAARSAQARGDNAASQGYLQRLAGTDATTQALLRAEQLLADDLPVDAINALDAANLQPLPPRGLWLRGEALARAGRAHEAYGQLGALRQSKVLPADVLGTLEARLAAQALLEAADVNALAAQWETTPKALRADPAVVSAYAARAVALDWDEPALLALEQALDQRWSDELVELYGALPASRLATREANLARWRRVHGDSPALLLAQGRVALAQGKHEEAEVLLHEAIADNAGAAAWETLGASLLARGDAVLAAQCLANALRQQRGEDSIALVRTDAATAGKTRATVEEQVVAPVPPVYDAGEPRDENGFPRIP